MSLQLFVAIVLRIFSIGLAVFAFQYATSAIPQLLYAGFDKSAYLSGLFILGTVLIAIGIWFYPVSIAKVLLPVDYDKELSTNVDANELLETGIVLIGIYLLFYVVSDTVFWIVLVASTDSIDSDSIAGIVATAVEALIVFFLLLGRRGITRLVRKMRYGE